MATTNFKAKGVIITGASSGIGRALALRLADQQAWLALAARDAERLEQLAAECQARGAQAIAVPTDVADEAACQRLVDCTCAEFGRMDMLVNNAGFSVTARLDEHPNLRSFEQVMQVNFMGQVYCAYHALPHLKETQGRIVGISSLGGLGGMPYNTSYTASKHALHGFYDSLRVELAASGVSVTVICPGWVATEFHERVLLPDGSRRWGAKGRQFYSERTMTADTCARITLEAAAKRKRQVIMPPGKMGLWLKLLAPGLLEWFTMRMLLRASKRGKGK